VTAGLCSANTTWLENYNAENGDPITISYSDGDVSKMLYEIVEGRVDATLNNPVTAGLIAKEQGIEIDWVPWTTDGSATPVYILYANNENGQSYKDLIEPALQTLLENGTLKALSEQYLGADYSTSEAALSAASVSK
jgi:L-cystine transport system substrate-binding protein